MSEFSYTVVPGKIKSLLEKIRTVGVPSKVTVQWLKTVGFTSSNDSSLIGVLKFIGMIDASSIPTSIWTQYRGGKHRTVLGDAIRHGYADLFAVYPDAQSRSNAELDHVFSTSSSGGKQVIGKTIATFKALVDEADFSVEGETTMQLASSGPLHTPVVSSSGKPPVTPSGDPTVHIDIQIHVSPEASTEQIDQIFASMAKHIYGRKDS